MAERFPEVGMDDAQAAKDRKGYVISMDDVTGNGMVLAANAGGGPEVGNPYGKEMSGEDYGALAYPMSEPDWGGTASQGPGATMPRETTSGNVVASAPQNRTTAKG